MFTPEFLFIKRIDELKAILGAPSTEGLFESARIMRQLLFDQHPLVHQVRRKYPMKVSFTVNKQPVFPTGLEPDILIVADGISPRLVDRYPTEQKNLQDFFGTGVIKMNGHWASVRDVVDYVANYAGVVHKNTPDTPMTEGLEAVARTLELQGSPSVLRSLRGIADVVVCGCEPLYSKIKEDGGSG